MRRRFSAVMVGLTLFVLALFSASFYWLELKAALDAQRAAETAALEKLVSVCREAVLEHSPIPAINYVNLVRREEGVREASCMDGASRFLAHTTPRLVGQVLEGPDAAADLAAAAPRRAAGPVEIDLRAPILVQGRPAGAARLVYDAQVLAARLHQRLLKVLGRMVLVSSTTFGIALLLALYLSRTLLKPIEALAAGAREIGSGHLDHRVPMEDRADELGSLAREFNGMAARLKELDELKEKFLQSITHDLRTPLTGILGYAELMLAGMGGQPSETHLKYLDIIAKNGHRLAGYINDILDVAKMQAGGMQFDKKPLSLPEVAASVTELLASTAKEMKIDLRLVSEPGLPNVPADADMLRRVITNLVSNAMKFTPAGGSVTVSVGRGEPGFLLLSVKDTGVGIPESALGKLFQKFYQVEETKGAARKVGTGLGLTITKEMIEGHGGRIWAESKPGDGAVFKFTLPIEPVETPPRPA